MIKISLILSIICLLIFIPIYKINAQAIESDKTTIIQNSSEIDNTKKSRTHVLPEGYSLEIPIEFSIGESKKDECRYSNPNDDADIDFMVFDLPAGEKGSEESLKKLREIIYNDISSFIPGYKKEEEKEINLDNMKGILIKASAEGDSSYKVIDEMSICLSECKRYVFILHLVYPIEFKEKYSSYAEKILKTVRKTN